MRKMVLVLTTAAMLCLTSPATSQPYGYESAAWNGYWTSFGSFSGTGSRTGGVGEYTAFVHGAAHLGARATGDVVESFREEQHDIDNGLYWQVDIGFEAQCDQNQLRASEMLFFDKARHQLFKRSGPEGSDSGSFKDVVPGTIGEATYKFLCAMPQGAS
jgi:hypothetical protein